MTRRWEMDGRAPELGERLVGTWVFRVLAAVLVIAVLVALVLPREPNIRYHHGWVWVGFVVCLLAWVGLARGRRRLGASRPVRWVVRRASWFAWAVTVLGTTASLVVAVNLVYPVGWDAKVMANLGSRLAEGPAPDFYYGYLSRYSNQVPFAAVSRMTFELRQSFGWDQRTVFALLNALCVGVSLQSVFVVVRRLRGSVVGLAAQAATFLLVGLSPWVAVPYTDVVTLPLPVLATALALTASARSSRVAAAALAVAAVVAISLGYVLKNTPVATVAGAACLGALIVGSRLRNPRRAVVPALVLLVSMGLFLGVSSGLRTTLSDASGLDLAMVDSSRTPPLTWWAAMGLTTTQGDTTRYGAYDASMVRDVRRLDRAQLVSYSSEALDQRLHSLGVGGYAEFAANKVAWNLGDGMFWAWGEGPDASSVVPRHGPLTAWVVSWSHPSGVLYEIRAGLVQGLWLALLFVAGVGLLMRSYRRDVALVVVSVVGIILFTLVFQGRSRYLFVYAPLFVALAGAVVPAGRNGLAWPARLSLARSGRGRGRLALGRLGGGRARS